MAKKIVVMKLSNERFVANAKPEVVQSRLQTKYDATVARDEMKKLAKCYINIAKHSEKTLCFCFTE